MVERSNTDSWQLDAMDANIHIKSLRTQQLP